VEAAAGADAGAEEKVPEEEERPGEGGPREVCSQPTSCEMAVQ
jgi:hypothetical protein